MRIPEDIRITHLDAVVLVGKRHRFIGCNARLGNHGDTVKDPVVRIRTSAGVEGWGRSTAKREDGERLLGRRLKETFDLPEGTVDGFLDFDLPLWDLAGRLLGKSVHSLLGDNGPELVPIYDGSIYMEDIDPETGEDRGVDAVLESVRMGLDRGYRAFKAKIGRGHRWMERAEGFDRDVEVLHLIRELLDPEVPLLIDGNNGFTLKEACSLLKETADCRIHWFEEPFPESREDCLAFKSFIRDRGLAVMLADGESAAPDKKEFNDIVRAGGIDVIQFDLRPCPITPWKRYLSLVEETGTLAAPHNWGSNLLNYYIPQFGRSTELFAMAETDTSSIPEVSADGYEMVDGKLRVPDFPGFGLELDPSLFTASHEREGFWSVAI